jgi:hypothetical protein
MTYAEAQKLYGALIRPIDAADLIGVTGEAIYDYWNRGKLKKITVETRSGKKKSFVIISEVNQLIKEREEKQENITISENSNTGDNIIANGNVTIKK